MENNKKNVKIVVSIVIAVIILALIILVLAFSSFGTVKAGYKGVKIRFGAVIGELPQGLYIKAPFIEHVVSVDIQTQKEQQDAEAASSDLQTVHTTVAVNYNVDPSKATDIYSNIGVDYQSRVIDPAIQESVKSATAKYTAEQLITNRAQVQSDIKVALSDRLVKSFIQVSDISVTNFDFSPTFNQAIEAKVTAQQNALAAKNKLDQVGFEAEQTVTKAKADAEAIQIQAQAIEQQGGANYVQLQAVNKWDGHLPTQMIPGATVPFLNLTGNK